MPPPRPYTLVAELSYRCPLHCPYCSNPVAITGERYQGADVTDDVRELLGGMRDHGLVVDAAA